MIQTAVSGRKVGFGQSGWGISARKVGFWPDGTAFPVGKWRSDVPDRRFPSEKPPPVSLKRSFGTKMVVLAGRSLGVRTKRVVSVGQNRGIRTERVYRATGRWPDRTNRPAAAHPNPADRMVGAEGGVACAWQGCLLRSLTLLRGGWC